MISITNIIQIVKDKLYCVKYKGAKLMYAKDVMKKQVISVKNEQLLKDALDILMKYQISGVPVIDDRNRLVGVLSEKDFLTKERELNISSYIHLMTSILTIDGKKQVAKDSDRLHSTKVKHVMSTPAFAVHQDATIEEVVSLMMNRHINRIPVVDEKSEIIGIIGRIDLLPLLINRQ